MRHTLLTDTREQKPLDFSPYKEVYSHIVKMKLDAGDYSVLGWESRVAFERKSLADLVGSLSVGRERFIREMERAADYHYFAIIIESSFAGVASPANGRYPHSRVKPASILGMLQAIQLRYNADVIFAGSRKNAAEIITQRIGAICV